MSEIPQSEVGSTSYYSATQDEWLLVKDAAERLGISDRAVRLRIQSGKLRAQRSGNQWRVRLPDSIPELEAHEVPKSEVGGHTRPESEVAAEGGRKTSSEVGREGSGVAGTTGGTSVLRSTDVLHVATPGQIGTSESTLERLLAALEAEQEALRVERERSATLEGERIRLYGLLSVLQAEVAATQRLLAERSSLAVEASAGFESQTEALEVLRWRAEETEQKLHQLERALAKQRPLWRRLFRR